MTTVDTDTISGVNYDPNRKMMGVEFMSGTKLVFGGVPQDVYVKFRDIPDMETHYRDEIRGRYKEL